MRLSEYARNLREGDRIVYNGIKMRVTHVTLYATIGGMTYGILISLRQGSINKSMTCSPDQIITIYRYEGLRSEWWT